MLLDKYQKKKSSDCGNGKLFINESTRKIARSHFLQTLLDVSVVFWIGCISLSFADCIVDLCFRARWYTPSWITQAAKTHSIRWSRWSTPTFGKTEAETGSKKVTDLSLSYQLLLGWVGIFQQWIGAGFFCLVFWPWKTCLYMINNLFLCFMLKKLKNKETIMDTNHLYSLKLHFKTGIKVKVRMPSSMSFHVWNGFIFDHCYFASAATWKGANTSSEAHIIFATFLIIFFRVANLKSL